MCIIYVCFGISGKRRNTGYTGLCLGKYQRNTYKYHLLDHGYAGFLDLLVYYFAMLGI